MTTVQIVLGVALFAIATAILYVWGLRKSVTQAGDLERVLLSKAAARIRKYGKKHPTLTQKEVEEQVKGLKGGLFWSRNRVEVQDPAAFAQKLLRYMVEQQLLEDLGGLRYRIK